MKNEKIHLTLAVVWDAPGARNLFKEFCSEDFPEGGYLLCKDTCSELISLLDANSLKKTEVSFSRRRQREFFRDYLRLIGEIAWGNRENNLWWTTNIASKNRFSTPLLRDLMSLFACIDGMLQAESRGERLFVVVSPSWPVVAALRCLVVEHGWQLKVFSRPGSFLVSRLLGKAKAWWALLRGVGATLIRRLEVLWYYGKHQHEISGGPVYIIKSFAYAHSFRANGTFEDPFFGSLSRYLQQHIEDTAQILTLVVSCGDRAECYRHMKEYPEQRVRPLECYVRCRDAVAGFFRITRGLLFERFNVKSPLIMNGHDISSLLKEYISAGGWEIDYYQYIHAKAGERLTGDHEIIACAMTFEGNPWEKMFMAGLRSQLPELPIYGYQHAVIPPAAAGVIIDGKEIESGIPVPSRVITTGNAPRQIICRDSAVPADVVRVGGALRYAYLETVEPFPRLLDKNTQKIVLVALEGVWEIVSLVQYTVDQARAFPEIHFIVRSHPVLPFERFLSSKPHLQPIPSNIEVSLHKTVVEDIGRCGCVLYWGTTLALEAIMLGRPVIHFDSNDIISYDPLFELQSFKWTLPCKDRVDLLLEKISSLSMDDYMSLMESAQTYVKDYFHRADLKSLAHFLPG